MSSIPRASSADGPAGAAAGPLGRLWRRLRDRVDDWTDRLQLDAGLLGLAVRLPLTRPVARRRAGALFDLCAGFVYAQVLSACVELDLFGALRAGAVDEADLAARLALPAPAGRRLLLAAAALDLVKPAGAGRWRLGPLGRAVAADPGIAAMVRHHALLYADLADPVRLLRGEAEGRALGAFWAYAGADGASALGAERVAPYTRLMSASQAMVAREVVAAFPFARHRRVLDVGGGDGAFLEAVAAAAPALDLALFDLPPVAAAARARFARAGLSGRATATGGDFHRDPLPEGADLVCLVRVLHDHDDAAALAILTACRRALAPGGTLLVAEPMAEAPGARRVGDAYFGLYLLAMGQGRARAAGDLAGLLRRAGFAAVERRPTALPVVTGLIVARSGGRV